MNRKSSSTLGMMVVAVMVVVMTLSHVSPVTCWGSDGHRIVAQIAQTFLSKSAATAVNTMLASGLTMADIATEPDSFDHSSSGSWSSHLHYVNLPSNATKFTLLPACENGCVVTAIFNYSTILFEQRQSPMKNVCIDTSSNSNIEPCALSFLTHFVGDCHQPLHVSYSVDEGGNEFPVSFYNSSTNLHTVWDTSMISKYENGKGWMSLANELISVLKTNTTVRQLLSSELSPIRWANDSFSYTQQVCYNFMPGSVEIPLVWPESTYPSPNSGDSNGGFHFNAFASSCGPAIGDSYYNRNIVIVKQQLAAAGIRLATLLNDIYAPSKRSLLGSLPRRERQLLDSIARTRRSD